MLRLKGSVFYLLIALSLLSLATGLILYFWTHGPRAGRLPFLGATKGVWGEWHTYVSLAALIVIVVHVAINRRLVKLYFKLVKEEIKETNG